MTFKIPYVKAVKLIDDYRKHFLKTSPNKVPNTIGGTIKKDQILKLRGIWQASRQKNFPENFELHEGLAFWKCWNNGATIQETDFFLSFEINDGIVLEEEHTQYPDFPVLARPFEKILDTDPAETTENILSRKVTGWPKPPIYQDLIDRGNRYNEDGKVLKLSKCFQDDGPRMSSGKPYNPFPFGLFENKNTVGAEVDEFLDQKPISFYRYYFGYDPNVSVNKIRVILIGVLEDGSNWIPDTKDRVESSESIILQNSWPPM